MLRHVFENSMKKPYKRVSNVFLQSYEIAFIKHNMETSSPIKNIKHNGRLHFPLI